VESNEMLLISKLHRLEKYNSHYKTKVSMPNVDVGFYYMNKKIIHAKNEWQYNIS
jgi:hypothetical protein